MGRSHLPIFRRTAAVAVCALLCASIGAHSEIRTLEMEIEPIIILNCIEKVDYTVETARLLKGGSFSQPGQADVKTRTGGARVIEARFSVADRLGADADPAIEIDVPDACSVRGLGRGEGFLVEVRPADNAVLESAAGAGTLTVRDARGRPGYGGRYLRRFTIPQHRIRLERPISIDVRIDVDLRGAGSDGQYTSPVNGVFAIEVTAP